MDTQFKKLIPSIYLNKGKAVRGLIDPDVVSEDPTALAAAYDNGFTDALMIFDLSDSDSEQELHNDIIRKICAAVRIPVIAAGRVRRMEDIKKFLYAGCAMACLNLSKDSNSQIAQEVADKVVFMDKGVVVEEAPAKQFFSAPKQERTLQFLRRTIRDYTYNISSTVKRDATPLVLA